MRSTLGEASMCRGDGGIWCGMAVVIGRSNYSILFAKEKKWDRYGEELTSEFIVDFFVVDDTSSE